MIQSVPVARFKWSRITTDLYGFKVIDEWFISLADFSNGKYTYYWNNIPIKRIATPFLTGHDTDINWTTNIGLIDENFSSLHVNINEIKSLSDIRDTKLNQLL